MIEYISGAERARNRQVFERLFRLRYQVFIKDRQWALPTCNGMEYDQYDCREAAYFYELEDDDSICSHVRLTPTRTQSLLADYFPHLVEGDTDPRGDNIWEATRYIVRPGRKSRDRNRAAKARLVVRMLEWCVDHNITHIQAFVDTATFPTYLEMTPQTQLLGLSHPYGGGLDVPGGGECVAWRWPVNATVIADVRQYGGLNSTRCLALDRFEPTVAA